MMVYEITNANFICPLMNLPLFPNETMPCAKEIEPGKNLLYNVSTCMCIFY
ncbi:hypothetical protein BH10BAC2_BH10BAC2_49850 [soil metagenome]